MSLCKHARSAPLCRPEDAIPCLCLLLGEVRICTLGGRGDWLALAFSVSMTLRRQGSALRIHRHRWYKLFVKKRKDGGLRRALAFAAR